MACQLFDHLRGGGLHGHDICFRIPKVALNLFKFLPLQVNFRLLACQLIVRFLGGRLNSAQLLAEIGQFGSDVGGNERFRPHLKPMH